MPQSAAALHEPQTSGHSTTDADDRFRLISVIRSARPTACRQLSRMMIEANCTAARKVDFSLS
ncbi:hypothetical protein CFR79_00005 [Komagataeibacter saccharivorans]|nr:hypothetical protein CFR79_00005 [Komagataeibacter saccharivorans]